MGNGKFIIEPMPHHLLPMTYDLLSMTCLIKLHPLLVFQIPRNIIGGKGAGHAHDLIPRIPDEMGHAGGQVNRIQINKEHRAESILFALCSLLSAF